MRAASRKAPTGARKGRLRAKFRGNRAGRLRVSQRCLKWRLESEGREEDGTLGGIEGAVEEEMCACLGFAAAGAEELFGFKMRLVAGEVASAGPKSSEESQLAA